MNLRKKLCKTFGGLLTETVNELEKIVDNGSRLCFVAEK
jgi:hypothetical protein